jgi:hypothetical protein
MEISKRKLNKRETRFVILFVLALAIAFSPSTPLGQVSAFIFLIGMILFVQVRPGYHLKKYILIFLLYSVIGFVYWLIYRQEFSFANYYLFFVTSSSFLILFFDFRPIISDSLLERLGQITLVFIFLESLLGIYQATIIYLRSGTFDGSAGDFVWGTLAPSFNTAYAGRGPSFVLLITTLLLFSIAAFRRRWTMKYLIAYGTVLVAWLLSSLMHSYLYFAIAAALALLTLVRVNVVKKAPSTRSSRRRGKSYGGLVVLAATIFLAILLPQVLPKNTAKIEYALREAFNLSPDAKFLKNRAIYDTIFALPGDAAIQPLIGLGPGQYASRAALMASGQYLSRPIPGLPEHISKFTESYILPHLNVIRSSLHLPSSSWLAIYGEFGVLGLVLAIFVVIKAILFFRRHRSRQFRMLNLMMLILIYYLVLMSFQNIYLEYTQAIFPAILSSKLCYDFLCNELELSRSPRRLVRVMPRRLTAG